MPHASRTRGLWMSGKGWEELVVTLNMAIGLLKDTAMMDVDIIYSPGINVYPQLSSKPVD